MVRLKLQPFEELQPRWWGGWLIRGRSVGLVGWMVVFDRDT